MHWLTSILNIGLKEFSVLLQTAKKQLQRSVNQFVISPRWRMRRVLAPMKQVIPNPQGRIESIFNISFTMESHRFPRLGPGLNLRWCRT